MNKPNSKLVLGKSYSPLDTPSTGFFCAWKSIHPVFIISVIGLIVLLSSGCKEQVSTPDWSYDKTTASNQLELENVATIKYSEFSDPLTESYDLDSPVRFVCYNLRNYLTMRRGKEQRFKPENEVNAVINNIIRANPDILGICEIGTQKDLKHLQGHLKQAGCHLPYIHLSIGDDPYRRQAVLSRYPLKHHEVPEYTYKMKGKRHKVRRGILDVTVQTPKGNVRFLGAHLKSKRPIAIYDQAEIRRAEAQILRKHASFILKAPTKLIVFGDMNDTKGSSAIRLMTGYKEGKLTAIELFDKSGTKWTQYWAKEDIYSRFDYVFASKAILPMINQKSSYILDTPVGDLASDHRALVILID